MPPAVGLESWPDFGVGAGFWPGPDFDAEPDFAAGPDFVAGADLGVGAGFEGSFIERLMRFFARSTAVTVTITF